MTRPGWNGKGLYVVMQKGYTEGIPCNQQTAEAWGMEEGDLFRCEPYLQINTVGGPMHVGTFHHRYFCRRLDGEKMKEVNIQNLLTVKSIVTLVLTLVFAYLSITGHISGEQFLTIFSVVIAFYFGTQYQKGKEEDHGTD